MTENKSKTIVEFAFNEGDIVAMKINPSVQFIIVGLIRSNGGNYYRCYDGEDIILERSEYELLLKKNKSKNKNKVGFGKKVE